MTVTEVKEQDVLQMALETFGPEAQTLMVFEEMSELQKELCKHARGKHNWESIADEIADVEIMLEQMKILHGCADEVKRHRSEKLMRLYNRVMSVRDPEYHDLGVNL